MKTSPLPWTFTEATAQPDRFVIWDANKTAVAFIHYGTGESNRANAEFIVRAVNSHDSLLAVCEAFELFILNPDGTLSTDTIRSLHAVIKRAKGAK